MKRLESSEYGALAVVYVPDHQGREAARIHFDGEGVIREIELYAFTGSWIPTKLETRLENLEVAHLLKKCQAWLDEHLQEFGRAIEDDPMTLAKAAEEAV